MGLEVYRYLDRISGALLPPRCILCGSRGQAPCLDLCGHCQADLPARNGPACVRCGAATTGPGCGLVCADCLADPPPMDRCFAAFDYSFPIDSLICSFKYRGRLALGRVLGTLLAEAVAARSLHLDVDLLLPVPLHPGRQAERGFNQSAEIARWTGRRIGREVAGDYLRRCLETRPQVSLSQISRRRNVQGAFEVLRSLKGARVVIIDDVLTTGSTAAELAGCLRRAGAGSVDAWCLAQAAGGALARTG